MAKRKPKSDQSAKPGPVADTLKIEGDWQAAMKKAVLKKKPADGWPKVPNKKKG